MCKIEYWEETLSQCRKTSTVWKTKWLSLANKSFMIKSVLFVVPIYVMSCFKMTRKALSGLEGFLKFFIWEGSKEVKKIPLINWDIICLPKGSDGAGLRRMEIKNLALGAKLSWNCIESQKGYGAKSFKVSIWMEKTLKGS